VEKLGQNFFGWEARMVILIRDSKHPWILKTEDYENVLRTHAENSECYLLGCVIHSPSPGHMSDWPLNWRSDRGIMERICKHGVGHPDYDQAQYNIRMGLEFANTHGCCGCCADNPEDRFND
jgi:hypothetical protein